MGVQVGSTFEGLVFFLNTYSNFMRRNIDITCNEQQSRKKQLPPVNPTRPLAKLILPIGLEGLWRREFPPR